MVTSTIGFISSLSMSLGPGPEILVQNVNLNGLKGSHLFVCNVSFSATLRKVSGEQFDVTRYSRLRFGRGNKVDDQVTGGFAILDGQSPWMQLFPEWYCMVEEGTVRNFLVSSKFFVEQFQLDYPSYIREATDNYDLEIFITCLFPD